MARKKDVQTQVKIENKKHSGKKDASNSSQKRPKR